MLVARGQPPQGDVGRESGICWQDVIDALLLQEHAVRPSGTPVVLDGT